MNGSDRKTGKIAPSGIIFVIGIPCRSDNRTGELRRHTLRWVEFVTATEASSQLEMLMATEARSGYRRIDQGEIYNGSCY